MSLFFSSSLFSAIKKIQKHLLGIQNLSIQEANLILDEAKNFIGFCTNEKGRQIGKTFYQDGITFEGNYYRDLHSVGSMTWPNGNTLRGEFGVSNAGYTFEKGSRKLKYLLCFGSKKDVKQINKSKKVTYYPYLKRNIGMNKLYQHFKELNS